MQANLILHCGHVAQEVALICILVCQCVSICAHASHPQVGWPLVVAPHASRMCALFFGVVVANNVDFIEKC